MNGLRLVLVTRRYWPLTGSSEPVLADLAACLQSSGVLTTVVTAGFDNSWPRKVVCRDTAVHRIGFPGRFGWSTRRYLAALTSWLQTHQQQFDLVCVSRLRQEAAATLRALNATRIPVVLRTEDDGHADLHELVQSTRRSQQMRAECQSAAAVIAGDQHTVRQLTAAGFDTGRIHHIPNGVPVFPPRTDAVQKSCRSALFNINQDLLALPGVKVVVYAGPLHPSARLSHLLRAWKRVTNQWPQSRLWLIGDGPSRDALFDQIRYADLQGHVLMPGSFDDLEEVFYAADLAVQPADRSTMPTSLLQAMAAGLPVVACCSGDPYEPVVDGLTGRVVPAKDAPALAGAILELFRNPASSRRMGKAAAASVRDRHSLEGMAEDHLALFRQLTLDRLELH